MAVERIRVDDDQILPSYSGLKISVKDLWKRGITAVSELAGPKVYRWPMDDCFFPKAQVWQGHHWRHLQLASRIVHHRTLHEGPSFAHMDTPKVNFLMLVSSLDGDSSQMITATIDTHHTPRLIHQSHATIAKLLDATHNPLKSVDKISSSYSNCQIHSTSNDP